MVSAAFASREQSDIPDVGVEPLAGLMTWFTKSVALRVSSVALVPGELRRAPGVAFLVFVSVPETRAHAGVGRVERAVSGRVLHEREGFG